MKDVDDKPYGLANIKVCLHATESALPPWQYALLDSGCTDNLVSLKSLQIILRCVTILLSLIDKNNSVPCSILVPLLLHSFPGPCLTNIAFKSSAPTVLFLLPHLSKSFPYVSKEIKILI